MNLLIALSWAAGTLVARARAQPNAPYPPVFFGSNGGMKMLANDNGTLVSSYSSLATAGRSAAKFAFGDVDGDGNNDIIAHQDKLFVLRNDGAGSYDFMANLQNGLSSATDCLRVADLDGDGKPDIIAGTWDTAKIWWNGGTDVAGNVAWIGQNLAVSNFHSMTVETGDLDGDGDIDIVMTSSTTNAQGANIGGQGNPVVLLNDGDNTRTFSQPSSHGLTFDGGASNGRLLHINDDDVLDFLLLKRGDSVKSFLGNGDGTFGAPVIVATPPEDSNLPTSIGSFIEIGDFNRDGNMDFLWLWVGDDGQVDVPQYIYLSDGNGSFVLTTTLLAAGRTLSAAIGDINDDGALDIVFDAMTATDAPRLYLGKGDGTFHDHTDLPQQGEASNGVAMDYDVTATSYARGPFGSNSCPPGYKVITTQADCLSAYQDFAKIESTTYGPVQTAYCTKCENGDSIYTYNYGTQRPTGCFQHSRNREFNINPGVGGNSFGNDWPICMSKSSSVTTEPFSSPTRVTVEADFQHINDQPVGSYFTMNMETWAEVFGDTPTRGTTYYDVNHWRGGQIIWTGNLVVFPIAWDDNAEPWGREFPAGRTDDPFIASHFNTGDQLSVGAAPTVSPTVSPTSSPSKSPTGSPTISPSKSPTRAPTTAPTQAPTTTPTQAPTTAPTASGPWDLDYANMRADFTNANTVTLEYTLGVGREFRIDLYKKDCATRVNTTLYSTSNDITPISGNTTHHTLTITHSFVMGELASSDIWNATSSKLEVCQKLHLVEGNMDIVGDEREINVDFDLRVDFNTTVTLEEGVTENATDEVDFDNQVTAYKCNGGSTDTFEGNDAALAPNQELVVCIVSEDDNVDIAELTDMNIKQDGSPKVDVVVASAPLVTAITSVSVESDGIVAKTRVPIDRFSFETGKNITISGTVELAFAGTTGTRKLRVLVGEDSEEPEAGYALTVNLQSEGDVVGEGQAPIGASDGYAIMGKGIGGLGLLVLAVIGLVM